MYYMRFNNDDGSSEEIELQRGHIFCKCQICGQEFVPFRIEFDHQFDSEGEYTLWNLCPDCSEKHYASERSKQTYAELSKTLTNYFKREIRPADVQQLLDDNKGEESNIWAVAQERFGDVPPSNLKEKEPGKSKIAQQAKSVTIIPRRAPR